MIHKWSMRTQRNNASETCKYHICAMQEWLFVFRKLDNYFDAVFFEKVLEKIVDKEWIKTMIRGVN